MFCQKNTFDFLITLIMTTCYDVIIASVDMGLKRRLIRTLANNYKYIPGHHWLTDSFLGLGFGENLGPYYYWLQERLPWLFVVRWLPVLRAINNLLRAMGLNTQKQIILLPWKMFTCKPSFSHILFFAAKKGQLDLEGINEKLRWSDKW